MNEYGYRMGVDATTPGSTALSEVAVATWEAATVARDRETARETEREDRLERALRTLFEHLASLGPACT